MIGRAINHVTCYLIPLIGWNYNIHFGENISTKIRALKFITGHMVITRLIIKSYSWNPPWSKYLSTFIENSIAEFACILLLLRLDLLGWNLRGKPSCTAHHPILYHEICMTHRFFFSLCYSLHAPRVQSNEIVTWPINLRFPPIIWCRAQFYIQLVYKTPLCNTLRIKIWRPQIFLKVFQKIVNEILCNFLCGR